MTKTMIRQLPAYRQERVIEVLEEYAANADDYDVHNVAAELRYLIGEQLAEERRRQLICR